MGAGRRGRRSLSGRIGWRRGWFWGGGPGGRGRRSKSGRIGWRRGWSWGRGPGGRIGLYGRRGIGGCVGRWRSRGVSGGPGGRVGIYGRWGVRGRIGIHGRRSIGGCVSRRRRRGIGGRVGWRRRWGIGRFWCVGWRRRRWRWWCGWLGTTARVCDAGRAQKTGRWRSRERDAAGKCAERIILQRAPTGAIRCVRIVDHSDPTVPAGRACVVECTANAAQRQQGGSAVDCSSGGSVATVEKKLIAFTGAWRRDGAR